MTENEVTDFTAPAEQATNETVTSTESGSVEVAQGTVTEAPVAEVVVPTTEAAPVEAAKPTGPTEEEIKAAVDEFASIIDEVTGLTGDETVGGEREATTGAISDELKSKVQTGFAKLPRGTTKASARPKAKELVEGLLSAAMDAGNMPLARTLFTIVQECLTVRGAGGEGAQLAVKVDPTDDFVNRVAELSLAPYALVPSDEVDKDWPQRLEALVNELFSQVKPYAEWVQAEGQTNEAGEETRGEEPEVHDLVKRSVQIAFGRRAVKRPRKAAASGEGGSATVTNPYDGPRRSVGKHIEQAFANQPQGTWLSISQIANFASEEYAGSKVSQGAVSARIYAAGGCTVAGIEPRENADGKKGAVKL